MSIVGQEHSQVPDGHPVADDGWEGRLEADRGGSTITRRFGHEARVCVTWYPTGWRGPTWFLFVHVAGGELYTLCEVKRRLGIGEAGLRQCRRRGLPVRRIGNRRLVLGDELIEWVRQNEIESLVSDTGLRPSHGAG